MENALKDVTNNKKTVRRAALEYGVPKSTLHDRVSGKVLPGAVGGAPRYLDDEEEEELVRWLEGCAEVGCAKNVREVRAIVGAIVAKKQNVECIVVSHGWWDRFRSRHPNLTLRAGESLAYVRAICANRKTLDYYFDLLEEIFVQNDLKSKPGRIFNLDESGIPLQHRPGKRIAIKGQKHVNVITSGNKTNITVLGCVSASGYSLPPMVIFSRKNLTPELTRGEVPGTIYGLSSSGWIDTELFYHWFRRHFLEYAPSVRPLLLLLDGHSSHYGPEFIRLACENGVIVFCLPPHLTHLLQPLDATCFHSLKSYWDLTCDKFMSLNPGRIVTIYQFSELFAEAWAQSMTPSTIIGGFRNTGVYPVNKRAVTLPGEVSVSNTPTAVVAKKKGILYMPFYSASPDSVCQSTLSGSEDSDSPPVLFTAKERECFQQRYEEGYDLTHDERYNEWLKQHDAKSVRVRLFVAEDTSLGSREEETAPISEETLPGHTPLGSAETSPEETSPSSESCSNPHPKSKLAAFLPAPVIPQKKSTQSEVI